MSAFSRLRHRAPLWRFCLYSSVLFCGFSLIWPAPWLLRLIPPLHRVTDPVGRLLTFGSSRNQQDGMQAEQPSGPAPQQQPQGQRGANNLKIGVPPIDAELKGVFPFAGRQLPLPAGIWHPVLAMQDGANGEIISNVLVRSERGVVTGVIVVRASSQSVADSITEEITRLCHDDRNYSNRITAEKGGVFECLSSGPVFLNGGKISNAPDISLAYERLRTMGFQLPPLLVEGYWARVVKAEDGGVNFEAVSTAVSPAPPGSSKLNTPPADWEKQAAGASPLAGRFIEEMKRWMDGWAGVLRNGFEGKLSPSGIPDAVSQDPSAKGLSRL
ncbi:hypothetical protein LOC54_03380 [Acetobacter sp. AN02]|uniref:hypothetical protein n=1 Tax=Acetobacter sp. AN02 TaxID=2894186 RepID=UPI0024343B25|nr:hypothetical protein [Acetobacter sp. AN02]MDG6094165.1 hypothetical protein [Acetobacter sp. AN02]